jgi:hypothetical protein
LVELPKDRKAVGCKWIYKLKKNNEDQVIKFKARLVVQGYSQKYGTDYDEVFAPVVRHTTIRVFLSVPSQRKMSVQYLDVKTAFLNGDLKETIFMQQPPGFE